MIFSSERDSRSDLYRVWLADRRVDRLTHHFVGRAIMPSVSPDGKLVAFAAQTLQRLQFWEFQIHILDLATGKTPRARQQRRRLLAVSWSPDGRQLANVAARKEPSTLQIRTPTGTARASSRRSEALALLPRLVEGRRLIAFSVSPAHHEGEDWDLAIAAPDGSRYQRLTTGPGNDRLPDWKP